MSLQALCMYKTPLQLKTSWSSIHITALPCVRCKPSSLLFMCKPSSLCTLHTIFDLIPMSNSLSSHQPTRCTLWQAKVKSTHSLTRPAAVHPKQHDLHTCATAHAWRSSVLARLSLFCQNSALPRNQSHGNYIHSPG